MADVPVFALQLTEAVANILAATDHPGLTATELTSALRPVRLELDPDTSLNKRTRLLHTLHNAQVRRGSGKTLIAFINAAMNPSRYIDNHNRFDQLQGQLNELMALYGLRINDQGKLATGAKAAPSPKPQGLPGSSSPSYAVATATRICWLTATKSSSGSRCSTPWKRRPSPSRTVSVATRAWAPTAGTFTGGVWR